MQTITTYISTYKGNRFFPVEAHIDCVDIEDIAHGLAYQCRFNGQTAAFYSVAQHSLMVASLVPAHMAKAALLHDAAEAYLGDMVKPLKRLLPEFSRIEALVTDLIDRALNSPSLQGDDPEQRIMAAAIKHADLVALATEKRDLMPNSSESWSYLQGIEPLPESIDPWPPVRAKEAFLQAWSRVELS